MIAITVVIPSDETIWKIIHSLGAEGDDFHGLNKVWSSLLNWESQLRYVNRDSSDYYFDLWSGVMERSQHNTSTVMTYQSEALNYRNDHGVATTSMKLPQTITKVIDSCIERGVRAWGNNHRGGNKEKNKKAGVNTSRPIPVGGPPAPQPPRTNHPPHTRMHMGVNEVFVEDNLPMEEWQEYDEDM